MEPPNSAESVDKVDFFSKIENFGSKMEKIVKNGYFWSKIAFFGTKNVQKGQISAAIGSSPS